MRNKKRIREPGVAGTFYPSEPSRIKEMINGAMEAEKKLAASTAIEGKITGGILPHAGMVYCARQTVNFFMQLAASRQYAEGDVTVVIVHPNHSGSGPELSTDGHDLWETPLGCIKVDSEFENSLDLAVSPEAQMDEHSAEVLVPYLQYFLGEGFRIVSVNMLVQNPANALLVAEKVFRASMENRRELLFIASSDFSHFLDPVSGRALDDLVLQRIIDRDSRGVYEVVRRHNISVCGYGPVMALMEYALLLSAKYSVKLLRRGHSGEVSPSNRVVNYNSLLFSTP